MPGTKNMYVLQSSGYISVIFFEGILHLIERCFVCCRDFFERCRFQVWGKDPKLNDAFHVG